MQSACNVPGLCCFQTLLDNAPALYDNAPALLECNGRKLGRGKYKQQSDKQHKRATQ